MAQSVNDLAFKIDPLHLKDMNNPEHSSYFFTTERYQLLIERLFELDEEGLKGVSTPFLISDENMYMYDINAKNLIVMEEKHLTVADLIQQKLDKSEHLVKKYIEEIDKLEDSLYMRKIPSIFLDLWFDLKKDLTRIDRIFARADETLKEYAAFYGESREFPKELYINLIEHIGRYQRLANLNSAKLDTLYNYYNSLKNDKINNNIYILTVLSGVFLPLNLVVGFFGMNTQNLFFSDNPSGTVYVVSILTGMLVILLLAFPLVQIIERSILRRLLGRFSLYNTLIENIKKITKIN